MKKIFVGIFTLVILIGCVTFFFLGKKTTKGKSEVRECYIAFDKALVEVRDENNNVATLTRGIQVEILEENLQIEGSLYSKVQYEGISYYVPVSYLVENEDEIVRETTLFVRTSTTFYEDENSSKIKGFIKKGEELEIIGYDEVLADGSVSKYKVKYGQEEGYVRSKYLVDTLSSALSVYDEEGNYQRHLQMGSSLGGGSASTLDYFPVVKEKFENNEMPDEVRALYINAGSVKNIDAYIDFAKENNINSFVIDIKDNTVPAYQAVAMQKYSPTNYSHALYSKEDYKSYIQKLKENGFYVIGRITVFKDSYYVIDHPEDAIQNTKTNSPLKHNNSYWPSAYNRDVWEFNVELAKESIQDIGFQEIQFDYVRFPDGTRSLEKEGIIEYNNKYEESKASAIQAFVMYAADEIHDLEAYISVDVFGESAHNYVTSYGQYWPAISNVVDVISGMPYPDHFDAHQYGITEVSWTVPYTLLTKWGEYVVEKQSLIPTPAIVRNWIQAYDTTKSPQVHYDSDLVSLEIQALYELGMTGGYMTWNAGSNLSKYEEIKEAFRKDYHI